MECEKALSEDVTVERISEFARTETDWWKEQPGMPVVVGGAMPECVREAELTRVVKILKSFRRLLRLIFLQ